MSGGRAWPPEEPPRPRPRGRRPRPRLLRRLLRSGGGRAAPPPGRGLPPSASAAAGALLGALIVLLALRCRGGPPPAAAAPPAPPPLLLVLPAPGRRELVAGIAAAAPALLLADGAAAAFANALPEVERFAANRNAGPAPRDLGLKVRQLNKFDKTEGPVLKECGTGPNCFSTTGDPEDYMITTLLPRWQIPKDQSREAAMAQLVQVVRDYPPGQSKVDGGGFQIVTVKDDYLYAQFESLKKGRVDDVEFHMDTDGSLELRSAGRIGQKADFGSNAKRLNYLSAKLRSMGWTAPEITKDTHPYYFAKNAGKERVQSVGLNSPTNFELIDEEPGPRL